MTIFMLKLKDGFSGERALVLPLLVLEQLANDNLTRQLYITDIGYYPRAKHHFRQRSEPIDQYVFIYCIDGKGWYKVGNNEFQVRQNQYFVLPAGVPHSYGADNDNPWTIYWMHFKGESASLYVRDDISPRDIKPELSSRINDRNGMFEEIFSTLSSSYAIDNLRYVSSPLHYYLGSLRFIKQFREANPGAGDAENIVDAAIHFMNENIEKHITLEMISKHIGYSVTYFSAMFKERTGHSPLTYINLMKMQCACMLLDTTDMKINQVCHKIGIDDPFYFTRVFTKMMGCSPKNYRMQKKV